MKNIWIIAAALMLGACSGNKTVTITVENKLSIDRNAEMIELSMEELAAKLQLSDTAQVVVTDEKGMEIPSQITYDEKLIFATQVPANSTVQYFVQQGTPQVVETKACGKQYPARLDDIAWENDVIAYRTYGPALQKRGDKAYGYDVFTKNNVTYPVLEERYFHELDHATRAKAAEIRKTDPKKADEMIRAISYHVDHGNGMDVYAVGPTLGGGTNALMDGNDLIYPWCYRTYEFLDNGPLRFTMKLEFTPLTVKGDSSIIETRVITLDAGSYMNKAVISYKNLKETTPLAVGLVMHDTEGAVTADKEQGYITYEDPTNGPDNGKIYLGAAFPEPLSKAGKVFFEGIENNKAKKGPGMFALAVPLGHVLAVADYEPESEYVYYFGSAWSRGKISSVDAWKQYVSEYAQKVRTPLVVTMQ